MGAGTLTGSEPCGHPADKLGWAFGGGARLNAYGGDYFQFQVNYTQGAVRYAAFTSPGAFSPNQFKEVRLPTLAELDAAVPDHPVHISVGFTGPSRTRPRSRRSAQRLSASSSGSLGHRWVLIGG